MKNLKKAVAIVLTFAIAMSMGIAMTVAIPMYAISFISLPSYILLIIQIVLGAIWAICLLEKTKLPEYLELKGIAMPIINKVIKRK